MRKMNSKMFDRNSQGENRINWKERNKKKKYNNKDEVRLNSQKYGLREIR